MVIGINTVTLNYLYTDSYYRPSNFKNQTNKESRTLRAANICIVLEVDRYRFPADP